MGNTTSNNVSSTGISLIVGSADEDEPGCSSGKKSDISSLNNDYENHAKEGSSSLRPVTIAANTVATTITTKTTSVGEVAARHLSAAPQSIAKKGSPAPSNWSLTPTSLSSISSNATSASSPDSSSSATISPSKSSVTKTKTGRHTKQGKNGFDVDHYLRMLFDIGANKSYSKTFCLGVNEIRNICQTATEVFMSQPVLLQLGTPVKVVGDIHGQFNDLMRIFNLCGLPPKSSYLFLGDYVDRGKQSLETIMLLLLLKIKYPENVFLLRGNHECANVTKVYGFYDECKRRIPSVGVKCWKMLVDAFNTMPIAATIGGRIFCVHGGLSPSLKSLDDIRNVTRPTDIPDSGLLSDLLWSDPDPSIYQWAESDRGVSYCFGKIVVERFCRKFKFDLVARGHMVVEDGYEFFDRRKLVTIFSAPNYCGEFGNWGAVMSVNKDLLCSFDLLKPNAKPQSSKRKVVVNK